jgi:hypothetical protein
MTMNFRISVTQDDIESGCRSNTERCPIALASRRAGLQDVRVSSEEIRFLYNDRYLVWPATNEVKGFVFTYDNGFSVNMTFDELKPFEFVLNVDDAKPETDGSRFHTQLGKYINCTKIYTVKYEDWVKYTSITNVIKNIESPKVEIKKELPAKEEEKELVLA